MHVCVFDYQKWSYHITDPVTKTGVTPQNVIANAQCNKANWNNFSRKVNNLLNAKNVTTFP